MAKQFYRVYWTSNDGDEMVKEIGFVFAENIADALATTGAHGDPRTEMKGEWFEHALYHAEPVLAAYQLEDLLNNLFWQGDYSTCPESRRLIINGIIKEFLTPG
jgi:hypothetical protein